MYCSKCGSLVNDALKYCKSCGAKLVKDKDEETPKSILDNLLTTLCFVVLGGLGILVGLVSVLLEKNINPSAVAVIAVFYLAALSAVCYLLLSPVPKLIEANIDQNARKREPAQPAQLSAPTTAQLEEHREPAASVTENTTRNFEKIPLKQD
jgi:hypothetical protein